MQGRRPACVLIAWLVAAPARAQPTPPEVAVALEWRGADGCLDTARLYDSVRSRRRPSRDRLRADAVILGRAERAPEGWQVELVVAERRGAILGRRSLAVAGGGCAALREHVALVVAMLVDSSVVERAAVAAAPSPPPARRSPARWTADAAIAGAMEAGRLPGPTPGLALAGGVTTPGGWRAELGLAAFAEARADDGTGATHLRWLAGSLVGCAPGLRPTGWWLGACAGLEVGLVLAEGVGFTRNESDRELLVDALARARLERRLVGPAFVAVGVSGRLAALRPRFGYEDEVGAFRPLYEPAAAAASVDAGIGTHFR